MLPLDEALIKWADELEKYQSPGWEALPDIDLYMDQVITYLERQMFIYSQSAEEKLITPAMINNYVKSEVIPRPVQKKYTREHLVYLMTVLSLKQVLSLSDITKLIAYENSNEPIRSLLEEFNDVQQEIFQSTSDRMREAIQKLGECPTQDETEKRLSRLALKLSLEANANRIASKKILDEITLRRSKSMEDKEKEKNKDKEKPKEK